MCILTKSQFNMKQYSMYSATVSEGETREKLANSRQTDICTKRCVSQFNFAFYFGKITEFVCYLKYMIV